MTDSDVEDGRGGTPSESGALTSSLLDRVKALSPEAWRRTVHLFAPTVYHQCRSSGLQAADATDIVQDVFLAVATGIRKFHRNRPNGTFRGWLWTITKNKIADHHRLRRRHPEARGGTDAQIRLTNLADPGAAPSAPPIEPRTPGSLHRRGLELIRAEFTERTWEAFWRVAVDECAPADVADELDMSVNAVYLAKSRVLRRLREELGDLLE